MTPVIPFGMPLTKSRRHGNYPQIDSRMHSISNRWLTGVCLITIACALGIRAADRKPDEWKSLFDGTSTAGWRGFGQPDLPKQGWNVENGCLHLKESSAGGDLITIEQFTDFELEWEWRILPKGNNGIKYLVTEARPNAPGHEYQMIDDTLVPDGKHQTASFYDVLPPQNKPRVNPPGQWNHSRLMIRGRQVEHWLNGEKVLAYELGSPAVSSAIAESKFKDAKGFGEKIRGPIMLTNHHRETWFRNIRIREFPTSSR